jgi:hypothetical protein
MSNKQIKKNVGKLESYSSKLPEFQKLPEGDNEVRLVSYKPTDSFHNFDGTLKDPLPEYVNATEQLIITVVGTDPKKGGLTHRLNLDGYLRYSELTDKELQSGKFEDVDGYACAKDKTGGLVRLTDEGRTKTCLGIIDQMFAAMQIPVGSGIEAMDDVIADKKPFIIKVTKGEYNDRDQYRIGAFKKVVALAPAKSELEA